MNIVLISFALRNNSSRQKYYHLWASSCYSWVNTIRI